MKLAFSTNGWTEFDFKDFFAMARDLRFAGIELHDAAREVFSGRNAPFSPEQIAKTAHALKDAEIAIPCLDAMDDLGVRERPANAELALRVAGALSAPCVRVLARTDDEDAIHENLRLLLAQAERENVTLLMETAGVYADTARLRALLDDFASDNLCALWDVHHPYRLRGETPEETVQNLGAYIRHVHLKDSAVSGDACEYRLMGEGTLPFAQVLLSLRSINYEGFLSLEWLPAWLPELSDAGIVFPHFQHYMSRFSQDARAQSTLYENRARTGKFVWKKDALIDRTFSQMLDKQVREFPDQIAFRYTTLDYTRTYAEFARDVDDFARALIAMNVKPGAHIAVWATNVPQWFITFFAATKIGCVLVTMNTAYKIHEAEYLLRQSDTHTLVLEKGFRDSDYESILLELCPELAKTQASRQLHARRLPFLRNVITVGFRMPGAVTWQEALAAGEQTPLEEVARRAAQVDSHDVCNMQYTSGTTGFPKGVMLTHYNIVNNGKCIGDRMDLSTADKMMIQVPMFHCFGMVLAMTASMTHGATLLPLPYFSPKPALSCIHQEHVTAFHGVPTMFIAMLAHEDFPKTDFSHMRTGIMAGSPCPVPVMRDVVDKMHMTEITIVYGQTEASPGCTMSSTDDPLSVRVETVGRALPEIECKIVDPETGEELPDGVTGEFVARGYNIMKGYYKMPQATDAAIDREGFLHTGDLALRTQEGNYRITGRLKDMIIRGGENIYPKEIEEFIYTHEKVLDVQVIGVPDKRMGEEIMACVIPKEGVTLTEEEIKDYVREHMARHKTPRYVQFMDSFPMNVAGKILKYKMRQDAAAALGLSDEG